jgi:hypothetical protein
MVPLPPAGVVAVLEAAALVLAVLAVVVLDLLEPHAATPMASSRQPAIAPRFLLITASPWLSCRFGRLSPGVGRGRCALA